MAIWEMTIGGKPAAAKDTFDVINPFDESLAGRCAQGTVEHVDRAVQCAREAQRAWAAQPDGERAARLLKIADLIEKNHQELAFLVTKEQGKPLSGPGANLEVGGAAAWTRVTASLTLPEEVIQEDSTSRITFQRK